MKLNLSKPLNSAMGVKKMMSSKVSWFALLLILASAAPASALWRGDSNKDIVHFGSGIDIAADDTTPGDVTCFGCGVTIDGSVAGDAAVFGGSLEINGTVNGDVAVFGGGLRLGPTAKIGGDVSVFGGALERDPQATIHGSVNKFGGFVPFGAGLGMIVLIFVLVGSLLSIVISLICYVLAGRSRIEVVAHTASVGAGTAFLYGLVALIAAMAMIFGAILLVRGGVGVAMAALVGLALGILAIVGHTGVALWIGRRVSRQSGPVGAIALGALLLILLQFVPLLGALANGFLQLVALGAALLTGLGTATGWLQQNLWGHAPPPPGAVS